MMPNSKPQDLDYAQNLVNFNRSLCPQLLFDQGVAEPVVKFHSTGDGLTTCAYLTKDLSEPMLDSIYSFRLAEFIDLGMMSAQLARRLAMIKEPLDNTVLHVLTFDELGSIVGYIGLLASNDPIGTALNFPSRELFPVEIAHNVDLLFNFASHGLNTENVFEIKRFVRSGIVPSGDKKERIPWHLLLGLGTSVINGAVDLQLIVGDSKRNGALRHLKFLGFDPVVIENTSPSLPETSLMSPSYLGNDVAVPFVGQLPSGFKHTMQQIESLLRHPGEGNWRSQVSNFITGNQHVSKGGQSR